MDKMEKVISDFVYKSAMKLKKDGLMKLPCSKILEAMRDKSDVSEAGWGNWKLITSLVTDDDLDQIETHIQHGLPSVYRVFLMTYHFYELAEVGIRFYPHPIFSWKSEFLEKYNYYKKARLFGIDLIPFGHECLMDAGPVCFDARKKIPNNDFPVVFWDHEMVGTDKEISVLFSSASAMFSCLSFAVTQEIDFICHDAEDNKFLLSDKKKLMQQFLKLDPEGAGSLGRDYWTAWGVKP